MPYVRDSWWSGKEFWSEQAMQEDAVRWASTIADARIHKMLPSCGPAHQTTHVTRSDTPRHRVMVTAAQLRRGSV